MRGSGSGLRRHEEAQRRVGHEAPRALRVCQRELVLAGRVRREAYTGNGVAGERLRAHLALTAGHHVAHVQLQVADLGIVCTRTCTARS